MVVTMLHANCFLTRQVRIFACFILRVKIRDCELDYTEIRARDTGIRYIFASGSRLANAHLP